MNILFLSSQSLITTHWPTASRLLEPVLGAARGEFDMADLESLCRDGRALACVVSDDDGPALAFVCEFVFFPRKTVMRVIALAGRDLDRLAGTFWPRIVEWAAECGVSDIEAQCAPAMTRMLRRLGFSHTYDTVRMPCH